MVADIERSIPSASVGAYGPVGYVDIQADDANDDSDLVELMGRNGFVLDSVDPASPIPTSIVDVQTAVIEHRLPQNVDGGTITNGAYRTAPYNTIAHDFIGGFAVAGGTITIPNGSYYCNWSHIVRSIGNCVCRIFDVTNGVEIFRGQNEQTVGNQGTIKGWGSFTVNEGVGSADIEIQVLSSSNQTNNGWGNGANRPGEDEVYGQIFFQKVA